MPTQCLKNSCLGSQTPWPLFLYPIFCSTLSTASYGTEHPFGQFRLAVLAVSPPYFLVGQSRKKRKPQHKSSTVQKWTKHCHVINTILITNLVCNTLQASVKKKAIPSQPDPAQVNSPQTICFWTGVTVVLCHVHVTSHYVDHFMIIRMLLLWQAWRRCSGISARRFIYVSINIVPDMVSR